MPECDRYKCYECENSKDIDEIDDFNNRRVCYDCAHDKQDDFISEFIGVSQEVGYIYSVTLDRQKNKFISGNVEDKVFTEIMVYVCYHDDCNKVITPNLDDKALHKHLKEKHKDWYF